jgi:hypothetical protein
MQATNQKLDELRAILLDNPTLNDNIQIQEIATLFLKLDNTPSISEQ